MVFARIMVSALRWLLDRFQRSNLITGQDSIMQEKQNESEQHEKDCNRSGIDRRQFSYSYHIPERRSGKDRRRGFDRRYGFSRRSGMKQRGH